MVRLLSYQNHVPYNMYRSHRRKDFSGAHVNKLGKNYRTDK